MWGNGNLRLRRTRRKLEAQAQFKPVAFEGKAYREAGGKMGRLPTAPASQMAMSEADGHPLILTVSGEKVYLELPGEAFPGYFVGKVDTRSDAHQIAEEEALLWQQPFFAVNADWRKSQLTFSHCLVQ